MKRSKEFISDYTVTPLVNKPQASAKGNKKGLASPKLLIVFAAAAFWLMLIQSPALAQSELTTTFTNNTGGSVNDLHIEYSHDVQIKQTPKEFNKVKGTNTKNLSDGIVGNRESLEIEAKREGGDLRIKKWWWTIDGKREGEVQTGCVAPSCKIASSGADMTVSNLSSDILQGVVTLAVNTNKGQIKITLPNDIRAGDTISGSVEDERKNVQAGDELSGAVVEINGERRKLVNRILTFAMPNAVSSTFVPFLIRNSKGQEIARGQIPVNLFNILPYIEQDSMTRRLPYFSPPRFGQTGRDFVIPKNINAPNLDGKAGSTKVRIGDHYAEISAKSPRMIAARIPANAPTGPTMLTIEEAFNVPGRNVPQKVSEQSKFNTLSVDLSAGKLHLVRGEGTTIRITLRGGEGMDDDLERLMTLELENLSPDVVRFDTGLEKLRKAIEPSELSSGVLVINQNITGIRAGTFSIRASLLGTLNLDPRGWVRKIAELKRKAANQSENTKNQEALRKNADYLDKTADNDDNWDKDGQPKGKKKFKDFLKKEKEDLDKMQKREDKDSEAWKKIGEAKDAVDKAAKAAGVDLK